jgi:hypothetical protein
MPSIAYEGYLSICKQGPCCLVVHFILRPEYLPLTVILLICVNSAFEECDSSESAYGTIALPRQPRNDVKIKPPHFLLSMYGRNGVFRDYLMQRSLPEAKLIAPVAILPERPGAAARGQCNGSIH